MVSTPHAGTETASLTAFSAYNLPSVGALVRYLHATDGFPLKSTWFEAIKAGWYATWPWLTYANASKYLPESGETIKGHMTQSQQGVRSTKPKPPKPKPPVRQSPQSPASHSPTYQSTDSPRSRGLWSLKIEFG